MGFKNRIQSSFPLKRRVNLTMATVIGFMAILSFLHGMREARLSVRSETWSTVQLAGELLELSLINLKTRPQDLDALRAHLGRLGSIRHLRVELQGVSAPMNLQADPVPNLNEVPGWFYRTVAPKEPIQVVREITTSEAGTYTISIIGWPMDEIVEAWDELIDFMLIQISLLILVFIFTNLALRGMVRATQLLLDGLSFIERGDYEKRLPRLSLPEFNRVAEGFNHMADALLNSRKEVQALTRHSLSIQEAERRHLARELHDELGQYLAAIKMMAGTINSHVDPKHSVIVEISVLLDRMMLTVRRMLQQLRPASFDEFGFSVALEALKAHWAENRPSLKIEIRCAEVVDQLDPELSLPLYRVIQECLTNTAQHAHAHNVLIQIDGALGVSLDLTVLDDGIGFDPSLKGTGFGLLGIRERILSLSGQIHVHSSPNQGTRISITVPWSKHPETLASEL